MPPSLFDASFNLTPDAMQRATDGWLITPNERLAREIRRAWDRTFLLASESASHGKLNKPKPTGTDSRSPGLPAPQATQGSGDTNRESTAWRAPKVASLQALQISLYRSLRLCSPTLPRLLDTGAWQMRVRLLAPPLPGRPLPGRPLPEQADEEEHLSEPAAARLSALMEDAWSLVHRYQISIDAIGQAPGNNNVALYLQWHAILTQDLDTTHTITTAQIPATLARHQQSLPVAAQALWQVTLARIRHLTLVAHEHLTPADHLWLDRLQEAGTSVSDLPLETAENSRIHGQGQGTSSGQNPNLADQPSDQLSDKKFAQMALPAQPVLASFATPGEERSAAAQWARHVLDQNPRARIGIVVPDLSSRRAALVAQFGSELDPHEGSETPLLDAAGGESLGNQAVWREASTLLGWLFEPLPVEGLAALQRARYLHCGLPLNWPDALPGEFSFHDLLQVTEYSRPPALEKTAAAVLRLNPCAPATLDKWLAGFTEVLVAADWPSSRVGSRQFQAAGEIRKRLAQCTGGILGVNSGAMSGSRALALINAFMSTASFAPERADAPVKLLGRLETTGLAFTHLWVLGCDAQSLPGVAVANPLLPLTCLQQAAVPRVDQTGELAFADRRVRGWRRQAGVVIFSYSRESDELDPLATTSGLPSALITRLKATALQIKPAADSGNPSAQRESIRALPGWPASGALRDSTHPWFVATPGQHTERWIVGSAPPFAQGPASGGATLLRDQAQCPFRAWAVHRAALRAPRETSTFADALDRGQATHVALQLLFANVQTREEAANLGKSDCVEAARQSLATLAPHWPAAYTSHEIQRIATLLQEWLTVESGRSPFTIHELETQRHVRVGGLDLTVRIDRIDCCPTDSNTAGDVLVMIDYKTGRAAVRGLFDARLSEPQLPLYAMTTTNARGTGAQAHLQVPQLEALSEAQTQTRTNPPPETVGALLFAVVRSGEHRISGVAAEDLPLDGARLEALPAPWSVQLERWRQQLTRLAEEFRAGVCDVTPLPKACNGCHLHAVCRVSEQNAATAGHDATSGNVPAGSHL